MRQPARASFTDSWVKGLLMIPEAAVSALASGTNPLKMKTGSSGRLTRNAPAGSCPQEGAVCPGAGTTCTCESLCQGGVDLRGSYRPPRWLCRPTACATAVAGEKCTNGLACEGCWGTHPFTCEKGRWVFHNISPPP